MRLFKFALVGLVALFAFGTSAGPVNAFPPAGSVYIAAPGDSDNVTANSGFDIEIEFADLPADSTVAVKVSDEFGSTTSIDLSLRTGTGKFTASGWVYGTGTYQVYVYVVGQNATTHTIEVIVR